MKSSFPNSATRTIIYFALFVISIYCDECRTHLPLTWETKEQHAVDMLHTQCDLSHTVVFCRWFFSSHNFQPEILLCVSLWTFIDPSFDLCLSFFVFFLFLMICSNRNELKCFLIWINSSDKSEDWNECSPKITFTLVSTIHK